MIVNPNQNQRFSDNIEVCDSWARVLEEFGQLPKPRIMEDDVGEEYEEGWIYRGHKQATFRLEPSIERGSPSEWAAAEYRAFCDFQARAPMHMEPSRLPPLRSKLAWLAVMQHYGAPTRLLDFTYSPYVALYFALRHRENGCSDYAEVWGFNVAVLREQAGKKLSKAEKEVRKEHGVVQKWYPVGFRPSDFSTAVQRVQQEDVDRNSYMRRVLDPDGVRREQYNDSGLVVVASPPMHSLRLSSQQGVFLANGAQARSFEESLELMMQGRSDHWYKRFRVPEKALPEIEAQLFQMNIHDLSLFPDAEGLAGFVRQRIRLHW